ncbi:MAG TPA: alpha/beta hydrolase [Nitrososphaeraceae archaeon]|nr:alpha/beta hydrolase [Nitrososphaeraceae archaeon]
MSSHRLVRKDHLVLIALIFTLVITSSSISNYGYFGFTKVVYGQSDPDQMNSNTTNSVNMQDPLKKVHVGDIDVAYKMFGKGDPIILFNGASDNMDAWDPSLLKGLSSNHTVIVFDQRGIANTTAGSRSYTYQQLANDTAGLLDALKIPKADVIGYSLGSYLAQQLTIMYPNKVNSLVLIGSSCGGKDHTPKPPEFLKLQAEIVNKSLNNVSISQEEMKSLVSASLGSGWIRLHPESVNIPANITTLQQLKPGLPPEILNNQNNVGKHWEDNPNWSGTCDELAKLAKPTLVITGTDDNFYAPHVNSLKIAEKIPGAWLVQIKNAGHAVPDQYPVEISKILNTFLSTTNPNN